jgi:cation transport regulator ChaB
MSDYQTLDIAKIIQALRALRNDIRVSGDFREQMKQINCLLKNDETGMVATILDFMTHAAAVPMKIETENPTLDAMLQTWQKSILNKDINIDIPRGLQELSVEYYKERWKSSFIGLRVRWESVTINGKAWIIPKEMWLVDGASIVVDGKMSTLNGKTYFMDKSKEHPLKSTKDETVIIRKPFNSWYDSYPTPFLVKRGVLFNALLKKAIINKQADVIQQIIPYLLLLKSGSDKLAEMKLLATEPEMKKLKEDIVKAVSQYDHTGEIGKLLATLSYDVTMEHFIPDLTKLFDEKVIRSTDKNILAGLGMIEVQGFAKTREETMLNPKALVEEVKDAVSDWACMLEEVMYQMIERNSAAKTKLTIGKEIRVVPSAIKAFMTDNMKTMLRNLYDRGLISKQTAVEDIAELDFKVQVERRTKETAEGMDDTMYPPQIQNFEQYPDVKSTDKPAPDDKKKNSPESKNYKNASQIVCEGCQEEILYTDLPEVAMGAAKCEICEATIDQTGKVLDKIEAPYNTVDDLPKGLHVLPMAARLLWLRTFNAIYNESHDEDKARKIAWYQVKQKYHKNADGKWVRK